MPRFVILLAILAVPATTRAGFMFNTVDAPGSASTTLTGINDLGQMVGWSQAVPYGLPTGFLLSGGSFSPLAPDGLTVPGGINDTGQVVGSLGENSPTDAFVLAPGGGLTTFRAFSRADWATGIDAAGTVVGAGLDAMGRLQGFVGTPAGGFVPVQFAPGDPTQVNGIDAAGTILVGQYADASGAVRGFALEGGRYTPISVPGAAWTEAFGVDDLGQVVGVYADPSGVTHGFLLSGGSFSTIDVPGAVSTEALGINDLGQVVGSYVDASGVAHGFMMTEAGGPIAAVPEPSSVALCGFGVVGAAACARRRRSTRAARPRLDGSRPSSPIVRPTGRVS